MKHRVRKDTVTGAVLTAGAGLASGTRDAPRLGWGRGRSGQAFRRAIRVAAVAWLPLALAGCGTLGGGGFGLDSITNMFKKAEKPLPGERIAVLKPENQITVDAASAAAPLSLPPQVQNASWSQPGGEPDNSLGHLAFAGSLRTIWEKSAGYGSGSRGRLTATPIVHKGKIFVLDTQATVSAFSAGNGARLWQTNLTPANEKPGEGFGGGVAAAGDVVYAATGFGQVVALAAASGKVKWTKSLGVPIRNSPTVAGGRIFVVTTEGRFYCLSTENGDELWSYRGLPEHASLMSNVSPAVDGKIVVAPYSSGEVVAFDIETGQPRWSETLVKGRTRSPLNSLNNTSRPVIADGVLYAVGHSGRMVATNVRDGRRLWQRDIAGVQTPWVAGNAVYVVDLSGQMIALSRKDGAVRWVLKLPKARRWSGPVLAGGKLWAVSSKGLLVGVEPKTGVIKARRDLGERIYVAPLVVAGRMYLLSDDADLIALN